jgi:hypothetical protein
MIAGKTPDELYPTLDWTAWAGEGIAGVPR